MVGDVPFSFPCRIQWAVEELFQMERLVLLTLQYQLTGPTAFTFLSHFLEKTGASCLGPSSAPIRSLAQPPDSSMTFNPAPSAPCEANGAETYGSESPATQPEARHDPGRLKAWLQKRSYMEKAGEGRSQGGPGGNVHVSIACECEWVPVKTPEIPHLVRTAILGFHP